MANCARLLDVDTLFFQDNVRTPGCTQLPQMVQSIIRHGFKANHPLVVSEKETDGKLSYLVLIGNRRGLGLCWLRDNDNDEYRRALPGGKVPAIVYKGLTKEEEVELRIDHSSDEDRVPLDDWSIFLAVRQFVRIGVDTQEKIATKLGLYKQKGKQKGEPNRSYVQVRVNLARLPMFMQDEFEKLFTEGKDHTAVRLHHISSLSKAFNAEYLEHPEGDGPQLMEAWAYATKPAEKVAPGDKPKAKEMSPADAVKRSQGASSSCLKRALLVVTGQADGNLADIDTAILRGEAAIVTLSEIRAYLGDDDFNELTTVAKAQASEKVTEKISA